MHRFQNYMRFQYRCPLSNGAVNSIICHPRLRLQLKTSLASFCPHMVFWATVWPQKSIWTPKHYSSDYFLDFHIKVLTCIHIYGASIWRGKNEANILLFSRNFYSSETHMDNIQYTNVLRIIWGMGYRLQPSVNKNVDWYYLECNFVRNMGFEFGQGQ